MKIKQMVGTGGNALKLDEKEVAIKTNMGIYLVDEKAAK